MTALPAQSIGFCYVCSVSSLHRYLIFLSLQTVPGHSLSYYAPMMFVGYVVKHCQPNPLLMSQLFNINLIVSQKNIAKIVSAQYYGHTVVIVPFLLIIFKESIGYVLEKHLET